MAPPMNGICLLALIGGHMALKGDPSLCAMTVPTHGHTAHLLDGKIVAMGGFRQGAGGRGDTRTVDTRPLGPGKWTTLPSLTVGKSFFGSAVICGTIYAVGGNIECWNPGMGAWKVVCTDARLPTSHFAVAVQGTSLYVLGREFLRFDTATRKLSRLEPYPGMKADDHFEVFAAIGDSLHVVGGLDGDSFDVRKSHWRWTSGTWTRLPDTPTGLFAKFAVTHVDQHDLYVLSGLGSYRFSARTGTWEKRASMPLTLAMAASFEHGGWLFVLGGLNERRTNTGMAYHLKEDRWIAAWVESGR